MARFNVLSLLQIAICLLTVIMGSASIVSFGIFAPHFVQAFDANVATISMGASIALLVAGVAAPVIGRLLDSRSVRSVLLAGGLVLVLAMLGASFSTSVTHFFLAYAALGLAMTVFGALVAIKHMTVWFPQHLGLATSLVVLPIGAVVFPPITNWLVESYGWRQSFQLYALASLVVTALVLLIKASPDELTTQSETRETAEQNPSGSLSSMQVYKPLLKSGMFWFGMLAFCVFLAAPMSTLTHFVVVAQTKGMTTSDGVLFLTIMGGTSLIGGPLAGIVADRLGPRLGYILAGLLQAIALSLVLGKSGYIMFLISSVILGLLMSAVYVFFVAYVTQIIGHENFGTGFGLATLVTALIGALPPTIAGMVYDAHGHYDWHFGTLAALALLSGIIAALSKRPMEVDYTG